LTCAISRSLLFSSHLPLLHYYCLLANIFLVKLESLGADLGVDVRTLLVDDDLT